MSVLIEYSMNKASEAEIVEHLQKCDDEFVPPLSGRVKIIDYAHKIVSKALRFEAWSGSTFVGLLSAYCNDQERRIAFITSVSVLRDWQGKDIAARLLSLCVDHAIASGMRQISLEVAEDNTPAIKLYEKNGFVVVKANMPFIAMDLSLTDRGNHE